MHLGDSVTALVDGRLPADAAERAHVHAAACPQCRQAVGAERAVRDRLQRATVPAPSEELLARLLAIGGPDGPYAPPRAPIGAARPAAAGWSSGPPSRHDERRPRNRRRRRFRIAVTAAGALSVVSVGVLGLLLLGSLVPPPAGTPVALGAAALGGATGQPSTTATAAARGERLDAARRAALREDGWLCPESLPGGLRLVDARSVRAGGVPTLHLTYSDGTSTVSVVEHRGRLQAPQAAAFSQAVAAGARVTGSDDVPWHGLWQSGDVVVAVVADAPPDVLARVVPALPPGPQRDGWWDRVERGADAVAALMGDG